ncbi:MAG: glycosyltransferase family 39 protein [Chloroflexota bacterium]
MSVISVIIGLVANRQQSGFKFAFGARPLRAQAAHSESSHSEPQRKTGTTGTTIAAMAALEPSAAIPVTSSGEVRTKSARGSAKPHEPKVRERKEYAFDPIAWPIWQQAAVLFTAFVLMYVGQFQIYRDADKIATSSGFTLLLVGIGTFMVILGGAVLEQNGTMALPEKIQPARIRPMWILVSIGLAAVVAWRSTVKPQEAYLGEHLLLWVLSMGACAIAISPLRGQMDEADKNPLRKWEYGLLVVLLLAGFAMRVINIDHNPAIFDNDEALFAQEGSTFIADHFLITPFEPGIHSHPRLYQAMIGITTQLFGATLLGARLPSILLGALTIPAIYLLGREIRDWQAGLIAALFLLPWSYHVQFSRLAMNQPADPLFGTLAFYFLLRGLRRGAAIDYALSGFMVGVAQMFYLGGRLIPLVMIAYLFFIWLRDRKMVAKQWRLLLIVPAAALVVTLPQNYYLYAFNLPLSTRADPSILFNGQIEENIKNNTLQPFIGDQIKYSFLGLVALPDRSGWYGRSSSLMGLVGGPIFLIGVIMSILVLWKRPKWSLPLGWALAVVLAGGTLAISPPQYERYFPGVVAFTLIVEMGVAAIAIAMARLWKHPERNRTIAVAIGVLLSAGNLAFYVGVYVPELPDQYTAYRGNWMSNRLSAEMEAAYNEGQQVVMIGGGESGVQNALVLQYFMTGKPYINGELPISLNDTLASFDNSKPTTYFVAIEREDDLHKLMERFPDGKLFKVKLDEDGSDAFFIYKAPASRRVG